MNANLHHPELDAHTTQPVSTARHLMVNGGWQLADNNPPSVVDALGDLEPGYVGGDQGSRDRGGVQPPEPSGRTPEGD